MMFKRVPIRSVGMKRTSRVFGCRVLRSGRRLFATRYEEEAKRARVSVSPVAVVDSPENRGQLLDHDAEFENREDVKVMDIDSQEQERYSKVIGNGIDEVMGFEEIKMGESQKMGNGIDDVVGMKSEKEEGKKFRNVYSRKRKRVQRVSSFEEYCGSDKRYEKKYFKKVRSSLGSSESCNSKDVFLRKPKVFSSIAIGFLQDFRSPMSHGFCKLFGSFLSEPVFTVDITALPFCFLYIHSTLLLKSAFKSYALIIHPVDDGVVDGDIKVPSIVAFNSAQPVNKLVVARKARSARKTRPRVSLFKKCFWDHVESIVPVPGVKEIEGYAEEEYVPFILPESYIRSRSDEVSRTLEKSYPIYDMDSDDAKWLKRMNNEQIRDDEPISEDNFEKLIDAFERGMYCTPEYYSDAASAIDLCPRLASVEVVEAVYRYWMAKRKKKRSPLVRVFQCYRRKRVRQQSTKVVMRKKRSIRRRAGPRVVGKQQDSFKAAMLNDEKMVEEAAKALAKVHEAEEGVKRAEAAAIVKRHEAQALMEKADLLMYRATMAFRIAAESDRCC